MRSDPIPIRASKVDELSRLSLKACSRLWPASRYGTPARSSVQQYDTRQARSQTPISNQTSREIFTLQVKWFGSSMPALALGACLALPVSAMAQVQFAKECAPKEIPSLP
jgi:hypothetical protein